MKSPKVSSIVALVFTAACLAAAIAAPRIVPADSTTTSPKLESLRHDMQTLASNTPELLETRKHELAAIEQRLWTPERFAQFKASLPEGWQIQNLGPSDPDHPNSRRFAISRSNAAKSEWTKVLEAIGAVENSPCSRIDSAAIATGADERRFGHCLITATFHFSPENHEHT
jgi:hypothetical protein